MTKIFFFANLCCLGRYRYHPFLMYLTALVFSILASWMPTRTEKVQEPRENNTPSEIKSCYPSPLIPPHPEGTGYSGRREGGAPRVKEAWGSLLWGASHKETAQGFHCRSEWHLDLGLPFWHLQVNEVHGLHLNYFNCRRDIPITAGPRAITGERGCDILCVNLTGPGVPRYLITRYPGVSVTGYFGDVNVCIRQTEQSRLPSPLWVTRIPVHSIFPG